MQQSETFVFASQFGPKQKTTDGYYNDAVLHPETLPNSPTAGSDLLHFNLFSDFIHSFFHSQQWKLEGTAESSGDTLNQDHSLSFYALLLK